MSRVTIKYDPNGASRPDKKYTEKTGKCVMDIILDELSVPLSFVSASLNGELLEMPVINNDGEITYPGDESKLTRALGKNEVVKIACVQQGKVGDVLGKVVAPFFNPLGLIKDAVKWIYDTPSYSSSTETQSGRSKNSLSGQSNTTNLYNAIPDRYGVGVVYPDLIDNEAFSIYEGNNQVLTQFMCVGIGEYEWDDLYLAETPIGLIPNATVTRYEPVNGVTTIPNYFYSRSVSQVSRSDLDGPGFQKTSLASNDSMIYFTYNSVSDIGRIDVGGINVSPAFDNYFSPGDSITLSGADRIIGDNGSVGTAYYNVSGVYTVSSVGGRYIEFSNTLSVMASGLTALNGTSAWQSGITVEATDIGQYKIYNNVIYRVSASATFPFTTSTAPDANFEIYSKNWGLLNGDFGTGTTSYQSGSSASNIIIKSNSTDLSAQGPFYTAIPSRGFLLDFGFYSGLKGSVTLRINYTVHAVQDGPAIDSGSFDIKYSSDTFDQLNFTRQFNYAPVNDNNYYFGVSVARTTAESTDAANPDTVKWDRFSAYAEVTNKTFDYDVSLIKVVIPYSSSALSPSSNRVNITPTRKTVTYDENTGQVIEVISPKTSFADALLHVYIVTHQRSPSELDLDALYEISNRIGAPLNLFSYAFDDITQSLEDKMEIICNSARVNYYWDGQVYRFYRDEKRLDIPSIIARSDIAHPDARDYSRSFSPNLPTSYDSVKVEYVYPDRNNEAAYVRLRYDSNGDIVEGLGINPLSITLSGCRNTEQARNRAHLEIRKLLYQRWSIQDTLMKNGYLYDEGDFIQYTDVFRFDVYSGEIINISGPVVRLDNSIILESGVDYELWYNDEYMNTYGPFAIIGGDGQTKTVQVVNESDLSSAYTRGGEMGNDVQVGSRFTINKVVNGKRELFTLTNKQGKDDKHVNIILEQYDERVFEYDD